MLIDRKAVGKRIQEIMEERGMTQRELAETLGISQPAVSLYLQGRMPPPEVLLSLARLGESTVEWLLTGSQPSGISGPQRGYGEGVREREALYGAQARLLSLWQELPKAVQRDLLSLMRYLVAARER